MFRKEKKTKMTAKPRSIDLKLPRTICYCKINKKRVGKNNVFLHASLFLTLFSETTTTPFQKRPHNTTTQRPPTNSLFPVRLGWMSANCLGFHFQTLSFYIQIIFFISKPIFLNLNLIVYIQFLPFYIQTIGCMYKYDFMQ